MARRDPNEPSDWAVRTSSIKTAQSGTPHVEGTSSYNTLGAYLMAPTSDPMSQAETGMARGIRPANLDVQANWTARGPGMFTRPNEGPTETPEQWETQMPHATGFMQPSDKFPIPAGSISQGLLFQRPTQTPATIEWAKSTKKDRTRLGTGLGIMQNEADRRGLGQLSEGEMPDLSEHSQRLVGNLTGREHKISNDMTFYKDYDRDEVILPREGEGGIYSRRSDESTSETRILSRGEANMGVSRMRVHMGQSPEGQDRAARRAARKRASEPTYTQGALFDEPSGPAASTYQLRSDLSNKNAEKYGARRTDPFTGE